VMPQFNLRWTILASGAIHGAVALALAWRITSPAPTPIPIGVEWRYKSEAAAAPAPAPVKKAGEGERKKSLQRAAPIASTQVVAGPMGAPDGVMVSELERYKFELRLFLESRKVYPEMAKRLHQTGTVIVQFKVNAQGDLRDINIEQPCSSEILNRAALDLIRRAAKFRPFPMGVTLSELTLSLPIQYIL